jgi:hypothetical protein
VSEHNSPTASIRYVDGSIREVPFNRLRLRDFDESDPWRRVRSVPVTLTYVGVGVQERGILHEGFSPRESPLAQFGRRTTALTLPPFQVDDDEGRLQWHRLLKTIEQKLVLAEKYLGMLAEDLSDHLFARSTGHFASLMSLINRGCLRAIRGGHEPWMRS